MIKHTVRFTVDLTINEGKFEEFQGIVQAMIAGTQKEPAALGYDWCLKAVSNSGNLLRCECCAGAPDRPGGAGICAEDSRGVEHQPL